MHVMQIDWGQFDLTQSNYQVGQVVSEEGDQGDTIEWWFLFAAGQGSPPQGMAPYTWPSSSAQSVTTTYAYQGAPPDHFDPEHYRDELQQQIGQGLVVQLIRADCHAYSQERARARATGKKATAKSTAKTSAKTTTKKGAKAKRAAASKRPAQAKAKRPAKRKSR
jgi:hypothetical protein